MSRIAPFRKRRRSESAKAKTQQRSKLKKTLIRKAAQYSIECESDVFVMIRVKRSGQRYIFNSSPSENWLPSMPELVSPQFRRHKTESNEYRVYIIQHR